MEDLEHKPNLKFVMGRSGSTSQFFKQSFGSNIELRDLVWNRNVMDTDGYREFSKLIRDKFLDVEDYEKEHLVLYSAESTWKSALSTHLNCKLLNF